MTDIFHYHGFLAPHPPPNPTPKPSSPPTTSSAPRPRLLLAALLLPVSRAFLRRRAGPVLTALLPPINLRATLRVTGACLVLALPASFAAQTVHLRLRERRLGVEDTRARAWCLLADRAEREIDRCTYAYGLGALLFVPWDRGVGFLRLLGGFGLGSVVGVVAWGSGGCVAPREAGCWLGVDSDDLAAVGAEDAVAAAQVDVTAAVEESRVQHQP
ncbi:unnamed protein product [Parascedosporium putredinis]|uniref:Uncharacterized protein n=1 Tax=Parascedosporium putredinis TaxID=1442378 RepID=A0A9P1MAL9_9PEZI|nr:unnamed protein product [Parascedosporium putredinis]CAI7993022.1 unnamed protein product [Parascedosporium putredinis]